MSPTRRPPPGHHHGDPPDPHLPPGARARRRPRLPPLRPLLEVWRGATCAHRRHPARTPEQEQVWQRWSDSGGPAALRRVMPDPARSPLPASGAGTATAPGRQEPAQRNPVELPDAPITPPLPLTLRTYLLGVALWGDHAHAALLDARAGGVFPNTYDAYRDLATDSGLMDDAWRLTGTGWAVLPVLPG